MEQTEKQVSETVFDQVLCTQVIFHQTAEQIYTIELVVCFLSIHFFKTAHEYQPLSWGIAWKGLSLKELLLKILTFINRASNQHPASLAMHVKKT